MNKETEEIIRQYVTRTGQMYENFGFPRISGEIGALLYLYKGKMSLDEISAFLGIAKGSASTNTRFLMRMKFIRSVRVTGDRKDYYEFSGDLWPSIQEALDSFVRTQVDDFKAMNELYLGSLKRIPVQNDSDQRQRTHMVKQLSALNTLYKYIEIARKLSNVFRETPVGKLTKMIKNIIVHKEMK